MHRQRKSSVTKKDQLTTADLVIACEQLEQEHGIGALLDALEKIVAARGSRSLASLSM